MKKKIEQRIKGDIGEWIETDGLVETLKIGFGDTDAECFVQEYVDDLVVGMGSDVDPEEIPTFSQSMYKIGMKHAQGIFQAVMAELRLVQDTMLASITRTLA
jgi:hypothetical protein